MPHLLWSRFHEEQDDLDLARDHASRAIELAQQPRQPLKLLAAHRILARLAARADQQAEAKEHIRLATEIAEACAAPCEIALTQVVQAEILMQTGSANDARDALAKARATAEQLKAQPLLERIDQLTERLGERRLPPGEPAATLTARELEVLRSAAGGLTDIEIAEELFISPRTVGGHLRSIYTKLAVNSRAAAIAAAREQGMI